MIKVCDTPIKSMAVDADQFAYIGSMDPRLYFVDIKLGSVKVLTSSLGTHSARINLLAPIPVVAHSKFNGALYADVENHCRFLEYSDDSEEWRPRPLGTFNSTVISIASSSLHNVIATASGIGSIHLSWISKEDNRLILEKSIVRQAEDPSVFEDCPKLVQAPSKDVIIMPKEKIGVTCLSWSNSADNPGLLVAGTISGHVLEIPCDRNILY